MKNSRRNFVKTLVYSGIGLPLCGSILNPLQAAESLIEGLDSAPKKRNILILGGTSFLGIHQVYWALERGHSVSIFTRGKTIPSLYPELFDRVEHLIGDRASDLSALEGREWDAVIDNSGREVAWTERSAELLKNRCGMYVYTSSTGVYYPYIKESYLEHDSVQLVEPTVVANEAEKIEHWYGVMKANSELAAIKHFGTNRSLIIRPTYMVGPADKTNRFIHWPIRMHQGGEILVPGKATDLVQYIDVRDVARWMIESIERGASGTFNAVGPSTPQTVSEFAASAQKAFNAPSTLVPVNDYRFLESEGVTELVPWILPEGNNRDSSLISGAKAADAGLRCRPLVETLRDTYDWWVSSAVPDAVRSKVENAPESMLVREAQLLEKWKNWQLGA